MRTVPATGLRGVAHTIERGQSVRLSPRTQSHSARSECDVCARLVCVYACTPGLCEVQDDGPKAAHHLQPLGSVVEDDGSPCLHRHAHSAGRGGELPSCGW